MNQPSVTVTGYTTTTGGMECKRCHRTDQPIMSNGYCTRCDDALYGKKQEYTPFYPWIWPWQVPETWCSNGGNYTWT